MELDSRKNFILAAVVRTYIRTGEPVGSKALLENEALNVSSATIRNEMSDLERMGYLCKPHTSAGRIPSNDGYRWYVEHALGPYSLTEDEQKGLALSHTLCGLLSTVREACSRLADFTECTTFAVTPTCHDGIFNFEVLPSGKRTLAILAVGAGGSVKTGFAKTNEDVGEEKAKEIADVLNSVLSKFPVAQIGKVRMMLLESEMRKRCPGFDEVTETVKRLVGEIQSYELTIGGSSNLLSYPEFSDISTARRFIDALGERDAITEAILEGHGSNPFIIRIGDENRVFDNSEASLITMDCDAKIPLVFGVIGPKRMDYARMEAGCRFLTEMLKNMINEEY